MMFDWIYRIDEQTTEFHIEYLGDYRYLIMIRNKETKISIREEIIASDVMKNILREIITELRRRDMQV